MSQNNELNESGATLNTNEVMSVVLIGQCSWHCRSDWVKMKNFSFHFESSLSFFFQSIPFNSGTCSSCLSISWRVTGSENGSWKHSCEYQAISSSFVLIILQWPYVYIYSHSQLFSHRIPQPCFSWPCEEKLIACEVTSCATCHVYGTAAVILHDLLTALGYQSSQSLCTQLFCSFSPLQSL